MSIWGRDKMKCNFCQKELGESPTFFNLSGKILCNKCFKKLPISEQKLMELCNSIEEYIEKRVLMEKSEKYPKLEKPSIELKTYFESISKVSKDNTFLHPFRIVFGLLGIILFTGLFNYSNSLFKIITVIAFAIYEVIIYFITIKITENKYQWKCDFCEKCFSSKEYSDFHELVYCKNKK